MKANSRCETKTQPPVGQCFSDREIELAIQFKRMDLPWEPSVGHYVYDVKGVVQPSSPFQSGVYFLLNYECFMDRVGDLARFKDIMAWLPTWSDARLILRGLGVTDETVWQRLAFEEAFNNDNERTVLYELIAETLGNQ